MIGTNEVHIHDLNFAKYVDHTTPADGVPRAKGLVPRDYNTYPPGYYSRGQAFDMPTIPESEWKGLIAEMEASKSRLSDIRNTGAFGQPIPSRDQNGKGYCWAHSPCSAELLLRARDGQPYVDLSAYAVACVIKQFQDEGGWGALALDYAVAKGYPSSQFWPQQSMSRSNDNAETWKNAALHKVTQTWMEAGAPYDRKLTFEQVMTCLLLRIPVVSDFNWWSHSVCAADPVVVSNVVLRMESGKLASLYEMEQAYGATGGYGVRIWNSWGDSWSENGMGVLSGQKAIPDGACAPRVIEASAA